MSSRQRAWVIGGTRGIGRAVADELCRDDWDVVVSGRTAGPFEKIGEKLWHAHIDTRFLDSVSGAYELVSSEGRINAVINCAGESAGGSVATLTESDWTEAINTKLLGYIRVCKVVLPNLRDEQGALLNVIGAAANVASPDYAVGCLNSALVHLTRGLAQEWCPLGVRIWGINPGPTETDRLRQLILTRSRDRETSVEEARREYAAHLYRREPLKPEELAVTIASILGPAGVALNGSVLLADGGSTGGWV